MSAEPQEKKPPKSITEEEIRQRAYKIWETRNGKGDAIKDWNAAIESIKLERSNALGRILTKPFRSIQTFLKQFSNLNDRTFALEVVKTFVSFFGLSATAIAAIGLYLTYQNNNERLITERFSKSIEQLGSDKIQVRLGGIYALERISKESKKDYWNIMEVLSGFVRERSLEVSKEITSSQPNTKEAKTTSSQTKELQAEKEKQFTLAVPTDIQAVATVLKRRKFSIENGELDKLDLRGTYLVEVDLRSAKMGKAYLREANLARADLWGADLWLADLARADLKGANLRLADLRGADLWGANLRLANLAGANLARADLAGANLAGANLGEANLKGACFKKTENLTPEQIKVAENWGQAYYDVAFRKQMGEPPDTRNSPYYCLD